MDLATILDALAALLGAGSLGFLAYGGWLCMRHAARLDDSKDVAGHAPGTQPVPDPEHVARRRVALD